MSIFSAIDISASGLTAQRLRMDTISQNIANVNTTRTTGGGPYRRKLVVFEAREAQDGFNGMFSRALEKQQTGQGVRAVGIVEDNTPPKMMYDPNHPDANDQGYVMLPNVNIVTEMVDMISATRAYEANTAAVRSSKDIALKALEIGR